MSNYNERRQRINTALPDDRSDVKRELKSEELSDFIAAIEKRLFLAEIAVLTGKKEKEEVFLMREAAEQLEKDLQKEMQLKVASMNYMERSFIKLETVENCDG
jgi:hypothetical protein